MDVGSAAKAKARIAGAFYLLTVVTGLFAEIYVRGNAIVSADAAATAHNILASETVYRLGFVADLIGGAAYVVVTALLYFLLRRVDEIVALLGLLFSLVGTAIGGIAGLAHLAPLFVLNGAPYLRVFDATQLQAMALLSLKLHAQGYLIALTFFGLFEILLGYLIYKSTFFPRWLGVLVFAAGLAFVINSLLIFAVPAAGQALNGYLLAIDGIGEIVLMLWLLLVGLNAERYDLVQSTW